MEQLIFPLPCRYIVDYNYINYRNHYQCGVNSVRMILSNVRVFFFTFLLGIIKNISYGLWVLVVRCQADGVPRGPWRSCRNSSTLRWWFHFCRHCDSIKITEKTLLVMVETKLIHKRGSIGLTSCHRPQRPSGGSEMNKSYLLQWTWTPRECKIPPIDRMLLQVIWTTLIEQSNPFNLFIQKWPQSILQDNWL